MYNEAKENLYTSVWVVAKYSYLQFVPTDHTNEKKNLAMHLFIIFKSLEE